jgi:cell fate (sporulation/competence/biofilm development) regulator YlbF (YheA/YmcA/DUF963 family)
MSAQQGNYDTIIERMRKNIDEYKKVNVSSNHPDIHDQLMQEYRLKDIQMDEMIQKFRMESNAMSNHLEFDVPDDIPEYVDDGTIRREYDSRQMIKKAQWGAALSAVSILFLGIAYKVSPSLSMTFFVKK